MILILGAGLAGISCSYHLNHDCLVVEKNSYAGGHIYSHQINGFTWDEGPHVSFTKHKYVKDLFEQSVNGEYLEYPVHPTNYYKGNWIPHPAQSNLYAIPEPIRSECLTDFLSTRGVAENSGVVNNYEDWIKSAFGQKFSEEFVRSYTLKYWTVEPKELTTKWVGGRVLYPDVDAVKRGFYGPQSESTHYITTVRYPKEGGYMSYADLLMNGMNVQFNKTVNKIDLANKKVFFSDGSNQEYTKLINTLPLPEFVKIINPSPEIVIASEKLSCSELLLLNYTVDHPAKSKSHWLYVYDEDKYSTRINFTELLSPTNGIDGKCGIQVEVYFSKYRRQLETTTEIKEKVALELIEMGLVENLNAILEVNTNYVNYANVIFDQNREESLELIYDYLKEFGLKREQDDLEPMTDWDRKFCENPNENSLGDIVMAGRFGQWKYYWTDDCVLRGKYISSSLRNNNNQ
jgi:protoporphyrinogen oxidase